MGFVLNVSFAQIYDFWGGWMGSDPAGDDGYKYGRWASQTTRRMVRQGTGIEAAPPAPAPSKLKTE